VKKGVWISCLPLEELEAFYRPSWVPKLELSYFTTRVMLHDEWGPRLERSAMELATDCLGVFSAHRCRRGWCPGQLLGLLLPFFTSLGGKAISRMGLMWMG
jgi:hypothetical protein